MTYLFISDLHLSPDHPRLVRGFLDLLTAYQNQQTQLYILGDWFNAWIGDDYTAPWLDEIVDRLKQFTAAGNQIFFLAGNRDFVLGQNFLDQFSGQLLADVHNLEIGSIHYRIEHGDALCTDDIGYQRFRKVIRNPLLLALLRKTPLSFRMKLAHGFRKKSQESQQFKTYEVMDVNASAVDSALQEVEVLIHGHTHRAAIHRLGHKKRIVLGDWKLDHAEILEIQPEQNIESLKLKKWRY
ncbi:UDP-2,3-diacylglucosamine diphosphatase [Acinetobacter bohemicus]|uniref:UDP-2,3-diacylglucosamine diphosphatase n=1 Tax=Acinetobacter TaxID=469 RepID=UPI00157D093E|nr:MULTISPECIES: UDP-2,3-diacylglucosamine diphosphatase [Acinetobacter]MCO8041789.1 UDP-2,3-diacylglucosamine diphosphatase [Acinetobacter sp. S4400-12]MCU7223806.1 UDP-2,3-diacylglucosamine diphosphatase [Acinetobacter bohemicus]MDM1781821.1 UDP-2,3-diacylglucosamine diphosphatase [Acinetobacter indicus]QKQ69837.1 UDP-2,3-diacylglucosamine diphosphatase [Acinetobacter sp. 10FS3-1]